MNVRGESQKVLGVLFEAEIRYYRAAREVQIVSLSRFLNYQSMLRNKYAHKFAEALSFNEVV
ncbi:hypothetical protein [uncultured Aquimarina sp.]|uniref:hypothetical protein n=1 Tax=uncultured Aquimarina sp. TaxID=575652 RepID=UPI00261C9F1C|nr:hypothetical protein [uncultured Aquimarina sp.]